MKNKKRGKKTKKAFFGGETPPMNMLFGDITEKHRDRAIEQVIDSSSPTKSFFVMTTVSAILCTLGIIGDNASVIIGGMLVAPMLSPILAISMGVGMGDFRLIYRSLWVVFLATIYSIGFSFGVAMLLDVPDAANVNREMLLRIGIGLDPLLVALVAGAAASLSILRSELRQYLAGTAIAVALIPPISMSAIGLRMLEFEIFYQAFAQFFFSLCGIVLSSLLIFSLSKIYVSRWKAVEELEEEKEMFEKSEKVKNAEASKK